MEAIHSGQISQLPSNKWLFTESSWGKLYQLVEKETMFAALSDGYNLHGKNLAEVFPDVVTTGIEDFLEQSWRLKEIKEA